MNISISHIQRAKIHRLFIFLVFILLFITFASDAKQGVSGNVLKDVIKRGKLVCGVSIDAPGFSEETFPGSGEYIGFDVDYCKAISAAIFGNPAAVQFLPLIASERFKALLNRDIDVLIRNTTHTLRRDVEFPDLAVGFHFAPTTFYDGQGFLTEFDTPDINNTSDMLDFLWGKSVCVAQGTTAEQNILVLAGPNMDFTIVSVDDVFNAYGNSYCDAASDDKTFLSGYPRSGHTRSAKVLSVTLTKEPLGPVMTYGDQRWSDIIGWVVYATFFAEEHGITQANINTFIPSTEEEEAFLGFDDNLGAVLGLNNMWASQVINSVGNYAEIYNRNLLPLLTRDQKNQSYINGGLHFAPPFR